MWQPGCDVDASSAQLWPAKSGMKRNRCRESEVLLGGGGGQATLGRFGANFGLSSALLR